MISMNVSYCCAMKQVFVENALANVLKRLMKTLKVLSIAAHRKRKTLRNTLSSDSKAAAPSVSALRLTALRQW